MNWSIGSVSEHRNKCGRCAVVHRRRPAQAIGSEEGRFALLSDWKEHSAESDSMDFDQFKQAIFEAVDVEWAASQWQMWQSEQVLPVGRRVRALRGGGPWVVGWSAARRRPNHSALKQPSRHPSPCTLSPASALVWVMGESKDQFRKDL